MTKRRPLSRKRRAELFARMKGICHLCRQPIVPPQAWDVSHVIPLAIGGKDDESNFDVAHRRCHRQWTAKHDQPVIAKTKRIKDKHEGIKSSSGTIPCKQGPQKSRASTPSQKPPVPDRSRLAKWRELSGEQS